MKTPEPTVIALSRVTGAPANPTKNERRSNAFATAAITRHVEPGVPILPARDAPHVFARGATCRMLIGATND